MTNSGADGQPDSNPPEGVRNALSVPDYRRLWVNNLVYMFVSNAQRFAVGWLVLDGLGGNETSQGMAVFMLGIPVAFIVMQAGVLADRVDGRTLLLRSPAVPTGDPWAGGAASAACSSSQIRVRSRANVTRKQRYLV